MLLLLGSSKAFAQEVWKAVVCYMAGLGFCLKVCWAFLPQSLGSGFGFRV